MFFLISIGGLLLFSLYYWRAVLAGVDSQPVSDRVLVAAQVENGQLTPEHFRTLAGLHDLTPDLYPNRGGLGPVRLCYRLIEGLACLFANKIPPIAVWSGPKGSICAPHAAVQADRPRHATF